MNEHESLLRWRPIDWTWVGVGYGFFVVFHLLPSYFIADSFLLMPRGVSDLGFVALWLFAGLALVGYYVGRRSRGVTILEPGISALLYAITLMFKMDAFTGKDVTLGTLGFLYVTTVSMFVIAATSAWVGEMVQERKREMRAHK